ncbi:MULTISPECIES: hypothetical protein [unclassified Streptomyces]|uniref:hypothetical protein n=1 Tax=unclassified Streptomyces TaxID=2593676 RepID=UPI00224D80DF|nr:MULTISPECIES: hypothetical protein [unclassified Streptomyces]MCX5063931.1 hypothetical protein [Streptomyces sp. NBC_00452]MCX5251355.1 hypothetical protein [Streptomyces sp. NBC_00201]MCX5294721.1 hypothetical protein [Streptomyces sp. NBC_00183]
MSSAVVVLLLFAGLSEAAGRIVPLVARRPGMSRTLVAKLLLAAGLVEGVVFALWPLTAWTLAGLALSSPPPGAGLVWTPSVVAPLVLAAVLAFPLLGPLLHFLLFVGVGAGLVGPLASASGLGWWSAAGCVAVAGAGLGLAVEAVRRLVVRISANAAQESIA